MASDLAQSARRIAADVEALTGERYTLPGAGITRYAYTDAYRRYREVYFALKPVFERT